MSKGRYTEGRRKSRAAWKWEFAASIGSFAFLVAMVIVLAVYDGKEIFIWHSITLNAVIAVLSTISRALLLFALGESISQWKWLAFSKSSRPLLDMERIDSASRGPLGGVQWLWFSKWKQRSLLQLGALVTILALAVDPFSQQLIQHGQKLKSSNDASTTIARAQRYSSGTTFVSTGVGVAMTAMADYSIQAAIFNALIQPYDALVQQTSFACPTGNCTWDLFESLAICSTCNDLTDQISSYTEPTYLYNDLEKRIMSANLIKNATSLQLPNGLYINNLNGAPYNTPDGYYDGASKAVQAIFMTSFGTGNTSRTNMFKDSDYLLWAMSFLKMQAPSEDSAHSNGWPNVSVEAVECGLFYCVNQYSPDVRNGTLYETETPVPNATREPRSWELINYSYPNLNGIRFDDENTNSLEFNNSTSSWPRTDLMFGNQFNLSWAAVNSLSSQFQSQFTSQKMINISEHTNYSEKVGYTPVNGFYKNIINSYDPSTVEFSPSVMQILYNSPDLNDTFRRLARGLSNAIREGADNTTTWTGASGSMTIYYRVQWPWITLQILVAVGGIVFLLLTILESKMAKIPIWKSNALAMLSQINEIGDVLVGVETVEEMERKAAQHFVQLFEGSTELRMIPKGPEQRAAVQGHPREYT
ncbi:Nn.00g058240.m01.CDS01 [Neocucurbitaria sp. VM-36]